MGVVYLPICPVCRWAMRLVRVVEDDRPSKVRVFDCIRCHTEMIWAPSDQNQTGHHRLSHRLPFWR
jgi:hypothetical protein